MAYFIYLTVILFRNPVFLGAIIGFVMSVLFLGCDGGATSYPTYIVNQQKTLGQYDESITQTGVNAHPLKSLGLI